MMAPCLYLLVNTMALRLVFYGNKLREVGEAGFLKSYRMSVWFYRRVCLRIACAFTIVRFQQIV